MDRMISTARSVGCGEAGNITIGLSTSLSVSKLRAVLADYIKALPNIGVRIAERPRAELIDGDLLPRNSHVVELGPFGENGHEAEAI